METVTSPKYYKLPSKKRARQLNVNAYREFTGKQSIPIGKQYWTLCNEQPPKAKGCEIVQLVELDFLTKSQFYGVDRDETIIEQNKIWHPEAHWYNGDWIEVIQEVPIFNPAMIYLDTTNFASFQQASDMVCSTMYMCKADTMIVANLMLSDPRSTRIFDIDDFVKNLNKSVGPKELKKWHTVIPNFIYNATGRTEMVSYILFKESQ